MFYSWTIDLFNKGSWLSNSADQHPVPRCPLSTGFHIWFAAEFLMEWVGRWSDISALGHPDALNQLEYCWKYKQSQAFSIIISNTTKQYYSPSEIKTPATIHQVPRKMKIIHINQKTVRYKCINLSSPFQGLHNHVSGPTTVMLEHSELYCSSFGSLY